MFSLFKNLAKTETIRCPHCLQGQEISSTAISAYCKNCRNRIDISKVRKPPKQQARRWRPKTKNISCPFCHSIQEVLNNALSAYCKNCHQRMPLHDQQQAEEQVADLVTAAPPKEQEEKQQVFENQELMLAQREVTCPHCGNLLKVPATALSSFCSECGNRINLQNYDIQGRFQGELETKGSIYISPNGNVEGSIDTGTLVVAGKFEGEIIAEQKVELRSTARIFGKITSPNLVVRDGAVLVCQSRTGPKP